MLPPNDVANLQKQQKNKNKNPTTTTLAIIFEDELEGLVGEEELLWNFYFDGEPPEDDGVVVADADATAKVFVECCQISAGAACPEGYSERTVLENSGNQVCRARGGSCNGGVMNDGMPFCPGAATTSLKMEAAVPSSATCNNELALPLLAATAMVFACITSYL